MNNIALSIFLKADHGHGDGVEGGQFAEGGGRPLARSVGCFRGRVGIVDGVEIQLCSPESAGSCFEPTDSGRNGYRVIRTPYSWKSEPFWA